MIKKIFLVCAILALCTSCSEFALLASGSSLAVSQNAYSKVYSGVDMITIMGTEKDIKKHVYESLKND